MIKAHDPKLSAREDKHFHNKKSSIKPESQDRKIRLDTHATLSDNRLNGYVWQSM